MIVFYFPKSSYAPHVHSYSFIRCHLFSSVDRSQQPDLDPSQPLTPQNRTANFITKLYIVLTIRTDLQHVIQWLPHGRSFRIVDPVEFELSGMCAICI